MMNDNKNKTLYYFAAYVMLMGIIGFIRTSATMPIYLNGSIALITLVFANLYYAKKSYWYYVVLVWVGLNFLMYSYMALFGARSHPNPTVGTYLIFGSLAIFSGLTLCNHIQNKNCPTE